jgi:hypothetical protein
VGLKMAYTQEISRKNPGCFIFLLDQSGSMSEQFGQTGFTKAQGAADAINNILRELTLKCTKEEGVRDYFDVAIIGYGATSGNAGPLVGNKFVKVSWLYSNPLKIEERIKKEADGVGGIIESKVKIPIWFEPVASMDTPMCQAFNLAYEWLDEWITNHPDAFPPIVVNITDGASTDGEPEDSAKRITNLSTSDGNVLLFNCHISKVSGAAILFPETESELPKDAFANSLFRMSSILPEPIMKTAEMEGYNVTENSRGFVFNADLVDLIRFLDIGTRVSVDRMT